MPFATVIAATDLTDRSAHVSGRARRLASAPGARMLLAHVHPAKLRKARLDEIERKSSADALLEEKVARIDQAVASAQARLDRVVSEGRRPELGGGTPSDGFAATSPMKGEEKSAFDGYLKTGQSFGLELKAGLSTASNSAGYVVPEQTERPIERRLMAGSPMREIASVRTVGAGV